MKTFFHANIKKRRFSADFVDIVLINAHESFQMRENQHDQKPYLDLILGVSIKMYLLPGFKIYTFETYMNV
jgi:hypothetical protein